MVDQEGVSILDVSGIVRKYYDIAVTADWKGVEIGYAATQLLYFYSGTTEREPGKVFLVFSPQDTEDFRFTKMMSLLRYFLPFLREGIRIVYSPYTFRTTWECLRHRKDGDSSSKGLDISTLMPYIRIGIRGVIPLYDFSRAFGIDPAILGEDIEAVAKEYQSYHLTG